jgi:cytochrome b subunit of formate dehydrogenase
MEGGSVCIFFFIEHIYIHVVWQTESSAGMIPRAVDQVFRVAGEMKAKGWEYKIEGQRNLSFP